MDAVRRLTESMGGAQPLTTTRNLSLLQLTDYDGNVQFEGNGTAAYPPLYNRDVFGFFPFQVNDSRFVIPTYVMTRNVAEVYRPRAPQSDPTRFDMPPEQYRMKIGGVRGPGASVSATDPLDGSSLPVDVVARTANTLTVEMNVTDSPRLLSIDEESLSEPEDPPPDTTPPTVRLDVSDGQRVLHGRGIAASVGCSEPCDLGLSGILKIRGARYPLHTRYSSLPLDEGETSSIVKLAIRGPNGRAARTAFDGGIAVQAKIDATASDYSGNTGAARRRVSLRR